MGRRHTNHTILFPASSSPSLSSSIVKQCVLLLRTDRTVITIVPAPLLLLLPRPPKINGKQRIYSRDEAEYSRVVLNILVFVIVDHTLLLLRLANHWRHQSE